MEAANYKKNVFIRKIRNSRFGVCFRSQNGAKFVTKQRFGNQNGANLVTKPTQNQQKYGSQSENVSKTTPRWLQDPSKMPTGHIFGGFWMIMTHN